MFDPPNALIGKVKRLAKRYLNGRITLDKLEAELKALGFHPELCKPSQEKISIAGQ